MTRYLIVLFAMAAAIAAPMILRPAARGAGGEDEDGGCETIRFHSGQEQCWRSFAGQNPGVDRLPGRGDGLEGFDVKERGRRWEHARRPVGGLTAPYRRARCRRKKKLPRLS